MGALFGSAFVLPPEREGDAFVRAETGGVVPFGVDPVWGRAENELTFSNSYKMKMSIILGVTQMLLGLGCSLANALHFRSELDLWCEFVPQVLFLLSTFGYLVFCIIYKWTVDWHFHGRPAPSLISLLIAFFMKPGTIPKDAHLYGGQEAVQLLLFSLATISVPWMLLAKPLLLRKRHLDVYGYKRRRRGSFDSDSATRRLLDDRVSDGSDESDKNGKLHAGEFDFAETLLHQVPDPRLPRARSAHPPPTECER